MSSLNPEFYAPYNYTPDVKRARHNLSTKRSFTVQTGALVPVYFQRMYKGDDFKIRPMSLLQTILPLDRQLLDCFELRIETYLCPLSNYYGWMDNNSRESSEDIVQGSEKWNVRLFSFFGASDGGLYSTSSYIDYISQQMITSPNELRESILTNPHQIHKGSMFQHIGVPAGFAGNDLTDPTSDAVPFNVVNIERILAYLDIVRCYHVNTQFEDIPFFGGTDVTSANSSVNLFRFPFTHQTLDDLFVDLRYRSRNTIDSLNVLDNATVPSIASLFEYLKFCNLQQGGFFPVQHRPDFMRNLLSIVINKVSAAATPNADGSINISEMQDKAHLEQFYNELYLSGGRYSNRLRTSFGMKMHQNLHIPLLLNVQRHLIDPSNITATAESGDYGLGQMAANVDKFNKGGVVRVRPDLDSYLVIVASITPLPSYSQGFEDDLLHLSFNDDFAPALQGMSFESVPLGLYSAIPSVRIADGSETADISFVPLDTEVGKNVKWMHYRTDVNRCYGEFTPLFGEFDNMVLSRRYTQFGTSYDSSIEENVSGTFFELCPYVNPLEYNSVFSFNSLYQEPWSLHISFDIKAKRPILKRIMPSF